MSCKVSNPGEVVYTTVACGEPAAGNDEYVMQHKAYTMRAYMLYLVGKSIFVDKSVTCVDVVHLRYFVDLERIHECN